MLFLPLWTTSAEWSGRPNETPARGLFIWGMGIGSDIDDALPKDQLDESLTDAAEALP